MTTPAPPPPAAAPPAPAGSPDELAAQAVADGAQAQGLGDEQIAQMHATMAAMQLQLDKLNAEKASSFKDDTDKYTSAVADQIAALSAANPDLDTKAGAELAGQLADGQDVGDKLRKWVARLQREHPSLHLGYLAQLLDERDDAAEAQAA